MLKIIIQVLILQVLIKKERKSNFEIDEFSEDDETRLLLREWLKVRKLKRAPLIIRFLNLHNLAKERYK